MGIFRHTSVGTLAIRRNAHNRPLVRTLALFVALVLTITSVTLLLTRDAPIANAAPPTISSIRANSGALAGGEPITITGSNFSTNEGFKSVSIGWQAACGITQSDKAYCWGQNDFGQLGRGNTGGADQLTPSAVAGAIASTTVKSISVGRTHACAVTTAGAVYCWGYQQYGRLGNGNTSTNGQGTPQLISMPAADQVSAGAYGSCAVTTTAVVYCWGWNDVGQIGDGSTTTRSTPVIVNGGTLAGKTVTSVSAGWKHVCVTTTESVTNAHCWGRGASGQLGRGSTADSNVPIAVSAGSGKALYNKKVIQIQASLGGNGYGGQTCALTTETTTNAYCWGQNDYGEVGIGTSGAGTGPNEPRAIQSLPGALQGKRVVDISPGGRFTCAATSDGLGFCWGYNSQGQLGIGSTSNASTPTQVSMPSGKQFIQMSTTHGLGTAGDPSSACARASDNTVYCWGINDSGQLGNNSTSSSTSPIAVVLTGLPQTPAVSSVNIGGVAATDVVALNSTTVSARTPAHGAAGQVNVTVTTVDGSATLTNGYQYLPADPGPTITNINPNNGPTVGGQAVTITGNNFMPDIKFKSMTVGGATTCGISIAGEAYCWGAGTFGQFGNGTSGVGNNSSVPVKVSTSGVLNGVNLVQISVSYTHVCAVSNVGGVYCWGGNSNGQVGDGTAAGQFVMITYPSQVTSLNGGGSLPAIAKIATGNTHTCAITTSQRAYCWGQNNTGQLGDGTTTDRIQPTMVLQSRSPITQWGANTTDISAGYGYSCAVADGAAYCWGSNGDGRLGDGTGTNRSYPTNVRANSGDLLESKTVTQIAASEGSSAGWAHTCAITTETTNNAYCWGRGSWGQLGNSSTTATNVVPQQVNMTGTLAGKRFSQISTGGSSTCAVANDNSPYCWGYNSPSGRLGNNSTSQSTTPAAVDMTGSLAGKSVTLVASSYAGDSLPFGLMSAGESHACALATDKYIRCWGSGNSGQMGNNSTTADNLTPTPITPPNPTVNVLFDTSGASNFIVSSNTQIDVVTPAHAAGAVDTTVTVGTQSAVSTLGYTYSLPATAPDAPTLTTANPATGTSVNLVWTAPGSDGGSPITDYVVEYSSDGGSTWTIFNHTASTTPNTEVTGLDATQTYVFRVSAKNAIGTGSPSNQKTGRPIYLTVASDGVVSLGITPTGSNQVTSSATSITTDTNNPTGYRLLLETSQIANDLVHQGDSNLKIPASAGTQQFPASLALNTWGYRVDGKGGFGTGTSPESGVTTSLFSWAGVPTYSNPVEIHNFPTAIEGDVTTAWYAMRVDTTKPAGKYTNSVLYTVIAD